MKKIIFSFVAVLLSIGVQAQYAEPAVTGANFVPNQIEKTQASTLKVSFANSGSTDIPANSIEITISTASLYYSSDGTTQPAGMGAAMFTWTYQGLDTWRGKNNVAIPAFVGGEITLQVKGTGVSPSFETTNINVQPVANFAAFADSPNNNNLQPRLKINTQTANHVSLLPKAYLQGALYGVTLPDTLMRDDLRVKGLIPSTSPYPAMGMTEVTPTGTVVPSVFAVTGANAIVDWVYIELRDASNNQQVLDSRSALIQRDGDIVDLDGNSALQFNQIAPANYYVVVKHRNHLGVMSKTAIALSQAVTIVDFRSPSTPTYTLSTNITDVAQVVVKQGVALWAGNALYDNKVIYQGTSNDVNPIYQQVINTSENLFVSPYYKLKGYYAGDINLNGEVIFQGTGNDVEYIYQNVIKNHTGNILKHNFFIIKEQLP